MRCDHQRDPQAADDPERHEYGGRCLDPPQFFRKRVARGKQRYERHAARGPERGVSTRFGYRTERHRGLEAQDGREGEQMRES